MPHSVCGGEPTVSPQVRGTKEGRKKASLSCTRGNGGGGGGTTKTQGRFPGGQERTQPGPPPPSQKHRDGFQGDSQVHNLSTLLPKRCLLTGSRGSKLCPQIRMGTEAAHGQLSSKFRNVCQPFGCETRTCCLDLHTWRDCRAE